MSTLRRIEVPEKGQRGSWPYCTGFQVKSSILYSQLACMFDFAPWQRIFGVIIQGTEDISDQSVRTHINLSKNPGLESSPVIKKIHVLSKKKVNMSSSLAFSEKEWE